MKLRENSIDGFPVQPTVALDKTRHSQGDHEAAQSDQHQPVLKVCQRFTVEGPSGDLRSNIVDPSQGNHPGKAEHTHVGVGNHPETEVGDSLNLWK